MTGATQPSHARLLGPAEGVPQSNPVARRAQGDQRSRLLQAIVDVVARHGYLHAKIGDVAECASVSRATFYEQFTDKEECFLAAQRELNERINYQVTRAIRRVNPTNAVHAALTALVDYADCQPLIFRFITHEALLVGPRGQDERERLISSLGEALEDAWDDLAADVPTPDIPTRMLLGATIRLLGIYQRRGSSLDNRLVAGLNDWAECYNIVGRMPRWRQLVPDGMLLEIKADTLLRSIMPTRLPRGRHRLPIATVKRMQRDRILFATAEVVRAKGYANLTVADVVTAAKLSRQVFYAHFRNRQEALSEAVRLIFEHVIAMSAGVFFTAADAWPDRVWEAGYTFTRFVAASPNSAYLFAESYAADPVGVRTDEYLLAFTMFLEDGYRCRPEAARLSHLTSDALVCAAMEVVALYLRGDRARDLPGLVPLVAYTTLTPFIGADAACELVDRKLGELRAMRGR
jgi:AcrR family transcriptional regulator